MALMIPGGPVRSACGLWKSWIPEKSWNQLLLWTITIPIHQVWHLSANQARIQKVPAPAMRRGGDGTGKKMGSRTDRCGTPHYSRGWNTSSFYPEFLQYCHKEDSSLCWLRFFTQNQIKLVCACLLHSKPRSKSEAWRVCAKLLCIVNIHVDA